MLYLLAASAEWLAAALALGLVVGFLDHVNTEKGAIFAGHGVVVAAAFALAGGFFLSNLQTIPGRAGLFFESRPAVRDRLSARPALRRRRAAAVRGRGSRRVRRKKKPPHVVLSGAPKPLAEPVAPPQEPDRSSPTPDAERRRRRSPRPPRSRGAGSGRRAAPPRRDSSAASGREREERRPAMRPEGLAAPARRPRRRSLQDQGRRPQERREAAWARRLSFRPDRRLVLRECRMDRAPRSPFPAVLERGRWVAQARELAEAARRATPRRAGAAHELRPRRRALLAASLLLCAVAAAPAQDMLRNVDLAQPAYSQAEFTRADIEATARGDEAGRDARSLRQQPQWPRSLRPRSLGRQSARGAARQGAARRGQARRRHSRSGLAAGGRSLRRLAARRACVRDAAAARAGRRRGFLEKPRSPPIMTGADLRGASFRRRRSLGRYEEPVHGADARRAALGAARGRAFRRRRSLARRSALCARRRAPIFTGASLKDVDAAGADLTGARFEGAEAEGLSLDSARIDRSAAADAERRGRSRPRPSAMSVSRRTPVRRGKRVDQGRGLAVAPPP